MLHAETPYHGSWPRSQRSATTQSTSSRCFLSQHQICTPMLFYTMLLGVLCLCFDLLVHVASAGAPAWAMRLCQGIHVIFLPSPACRKGKERRAFLLPALEASWPIGGAPSPRTLDDSSEGNHPISEDARRLLGREQLAAGESTGTCGVMANHTKSITQTLPAPKVCGSGGVVGACL